MADENDNIQINDNIILNDQEAEQLLADPEDDAEAKKSDRADKDTTDWKAEAEKWRTASRKHEKFHKEATAKLQQFEDQGKSELEKLTEDRDRTRAEAAKASARAQAMTTAIDLAPDWATPAIIKKVAKRARGESDEELAEDINDLYEMAAPKGAAAPKTPTRPKERLKGGAEPDDEPEESDGRKIAAKIPRSTLLNI